MASHDYTVPEHPIGSPRSMRIVCMGAGYSGLMMGIIFSQRLQCTGAEFLIYERNEDLGGSWLKNRYPSSRTDIAAHNYAYSFAPNPKWPNFFGTAEQIHAYMIDTAKTYGVEQYIRCRHTVKSAEWIENKGKWTIAIADGEGVVFKDECDVFINASGVLSNWKWPAIDGLPDFGGKLMHSARWDRSYDFTGKKVACIGLGSSAIQLIPQLAKMVTHLDCHARSPIWIDPGAGTNIPTGTEAEMNDSQEFSAASLESFKDPEVLRLYRAAIMDQRLGDFKLSITDSQEQRSAREAFTKSMIDRLGNSDKGKRVANLLLPSYPVGSRGITSGPGFLEALTRDNVDLKWNEIERITATGMQLRDGSTVEYDAIVCATGFDTSFRPPVPIVGRNGVDLAEKWTRNTPKAYFGMCVPEFPNYFCFLGPNYPFHNGSLVLAFQMTAIYIYRWLEKMQTQNIRSMEVREAANAEYNQHAQRFLKRTVWSHSPETYWFKQGDEVVGLYSGTVFHYMEALKNPRWEDFHMELTPETQNNRFAFLGNGYTQAESRGASVGATQTLTFDEYWDLFVLPNVHS